MGEIADGLLNGDFDYVTGEYLGEGDGYPRSNFDTKKYTGNGSVETSTKRVVEYFKNYLIVELQGGGLNIKLPNNGTVTVWWRKGKWTHSKNANKWFYFRNQPKEHANELIAQIEGLMRGSVNPQNKVTNIEPELPETDSGTQKCIDHILKKIEICKKNNGNNAVITTLIALSDELKQFL